MSKLPPVEKLPLAVRKNVRDEWDNKKADLEKKLSDLLGTSWTAEVNPNQLYAYAGDGYAKESLGSCMAGYFDGAISRLREYVERFGEGGVQELNTICHAHVITIDFDDEKRFSYCGTDVRDGQLRILFTEGNMGTNIDYALERDVLLKALNEAPTPEGSDGALSFAARTNIRQEYEGQVDRVRKEIGEILAKPDIKLNPNFEETFSKLSEASKKKIDLRDDWQSQLGYITREYFEGLTSQLKWQKFPEDDLLQEGFHEAVDKGEIKFRVVDQLKDGSYSEALVEDGILYLQTTPATWGVNVPYTAEKLVDKL